jgi:hypothetical protein
MPGERRPTLVNAGVVKERRKGGLFTFFLSSTIVTEKAVRNNTKAPLCHAHLKINLNINHSLRALKEEPSAVNAE